jgi:hypothetical protein
MASSAFAKAMDKKKNASKLLQKAREAEQNSFEMPEINDGQYVARIRAGVGVTPNKGVPYVEFKWTIVDDEEYTGKGYRQTFFLENDDSEKLDKTFTFLGRALKALTGLDDLDLDDFGAVEEIVNEIDSEKPHCRISVKNWEHNGKRGMTTYFNERVEVVTENDHPTDTEAGADDTASTPTSNDIVEKGNTVLHEGSEYKVVTSSPRYKTCTLQDEDKNRVDNVAWDEVEVIG